MRDTSSLTLPWWFMLLFLIAKESSSAQPSLASIAPTLTLWPPPTSANPQAARLACGSEGPALCSWFPWPHLWCYHLHTPVLDLTTHSQPWPKDRSNPTIHWWINNKQNMVHIYFGILFSLEKEGNSDICYSMDETSHCAKWNKPDTKEDISEDSVHMRCPECSNSQRQKVEWWL